MAVSSLTACAGGAGAAATSPHGLESPTSREPIIEKLASSALLGGPETCFDGIDDNGNGLLDEGCAVRQGNVQFMAGWQGAEVDVDLLVVDPAGEGASTPEATSLGFVHSGDCPSDERRCSGHLYETVYLEEEEIPVGQCEVRLRLEGAPEPARLIDEPVVVTLGVRLPHQTLAYRVGFHSLGQEAVFQFEIPEALLPADEEDDPEAADDGPADGTRARDASGGES